MGGCAMKKLPIGIQTFEKIRSDDYIYIDKTAIALDIIQSYQYVFLSRPRRFGKSLFLDTLKNIFEGKKELFEGLAIYDQWDWNEKYPVIKISWDGQLRDLNGLQSVINHSLGINQERLGITCSEKDNAAVCFAELIIKASRKYKQKVVILIDEYDRPILEVIENPEKSIEAREFLRGFYSVIKGSDEYLRFAFLTGVSKFSKASIFSGLNMLADISLNPRYGNVCGYTQNDLEYSFAEYLEGANLDKIKTWYNGYNFLGDSLYNPFDILLYFANDRRFENYWFSTGTPSFLIKLIQKNHYFLPRLSNMMVDQKLLNSFDIERLDLEVILYQSGYLTIKKAIENPRGGYKYELRIPNQEVRQSLSDFIIDMLINDDKTLNSQLQDGLYETLVEADLDGFSKYLTTLFAKIPYSSFNQGKLITYEGIYASVIYTYLASLGFEIVGEDVTNKGRIDLTIHLPKIIYILEFKVDEKGALEQIKSKNYHQKYLNQGKKIYLLGIEFSSKERNITNLEWEAVQ
jgi:hypothetical protein